MWVLVSAKSNFDSHRTKEIIRNFDNRISSRETAVVLKKRGITQAAKGLAAVEKLLTGVREFRSISKNFRTYTKTGNMQTALEDFYSVKPYVAANRNKNTYHLFRGYARGGQNLIGLVGDRRLILLNNGDKYSRRLPVLEIRSPLDALYDRIVYKPEK